MNKENKGACPESNDVVASQGESNGCKSIVSDILDILDLVISREGHDTLMLMDGIDKEATEMIKKFVNHERLANQLLALLVMDLGYIETPIHGHAPIRHQIAWKLAVDTIGAGEVKERVKIMKKQAEIEQ